MITRSSSSSCCFKDVFIPILAYFSHSGLATSFSRKEKHGVIARTGLPQPLVIEPSQYFEGNDGNWSTFNLRIGTPGQDVRVLISTASANSMVVWSDYGCSSAVFDAVPFDCAKKRGQLFNPNTSSTWTPQGTFSINKDGVGFEANLGYKQNAEYGLDTLGLGLMSLPLQNQTVAAFNDADAFYLGIFGLGTQPVNYSLLGNFSAPSFITTLKNQNAIPSLSWSYTAGAPYQLKNVFGQLIFGGYDAARIQPNSASFELGQDQNRDILVAVQEIIFTGSTQTNLLSAPIFAFIDSTDPLLWLPESACSAFEKAFSLTLGPATDRYLLNESQHIALKEADSSVTFYLSNSLTGGETVRIDLPYSAFDLKVDYPIVEKPTYYFPLRRASNESQYTLGRTFLQEAYLTVNYESRNFSVHQCTWDDKTLTPTILPILSTSTKTLESPIPATPSILGPESPTAISHASLNPLAPAAIAGITVGAILLLAFLCFLIVYFLIYRPRLKARSRDSVFPSRGILPNNSDERIPEGTITELDSAPEIHEAPSSTSLDELATTYDESERSGSFSGVASATSEVVSPASSNPEGGRSWLDSPYSSKANSSFRTFRSRERNKRIGREKEMLRAEGLAELE